jgi:hypothetical protein
MSNRAILAHFRERYGLNLDTIKEHRLGYDSYRDAKVYPVFEDPEKRRPVAIKIRFLDPDADPDRLNSGGTIRWWYPDLPDGRTLLYLPGEMDVLLARQWAIPAFTTTSGWPPKDLSRLPTLRGRRVLFLPDAGSAGEARAAQRAAEGATQAGADAVVLEWPAGLPKGTDLNDWHVKHGGNKTRLLALIKQRLRKERA